MSNMSVAASMCGQRPHSGYSSSWCQAPHGNAAQHPSSLLMMFLNLSEVQESLLVRVQEGFGDRFEVLSLESESRPLRVLSFELNCISRSNADDFLAMLAEEKAAYEGLRMSSRTDANAFSFEKIAGRDGCLTHVRIAVATRHECGRKTLRRDLASFVLRSFERNPLYNTHLKRMENGV